LSLPSGHAATIFTALCFMHLLVTQKSLWFCGLSLLGAVVVAYTRVYLCQHFYQDIYVGAWVGTLTTTLVYGALMNWQGPAWLDQRFPTPLLAKGKQRTPWLPLAWWSAIKALFFSICYQKNLLNVVVLCYQVGVSTPSTIGNRVPYLYFSYKLALCVFSTRLSVLV